MAKAHKAFIVVTILSSVTILTSCSESDFLQTASKGAEAKAEAEARWVRAERDRANARMACAYADDNRACEKYGAAPKR